MGTRYAPESGGQPDATASVPAGATRFGPEHGADGGAPHDETQGRGPPAGLVQVRRGIARQLVGAVPEADEDGARQEEREGSVMTPLAAITAPTTEMR